MGVHLYATCPGANRQAAERLVVVHNAVAVSSDVGRLTNERATAVRMHVHNKRQVRASTASWLAGSNVARLATFDRAVDGVLIRRHAQERWQVQRPCRASAFHSGFQVTGLVKLESGEDEGRHVEQHMRLQQWKSCFGYFDLGEMFIDNETRSFLR